MSAPTPRHLQSLFTVHCPERSCEEALRAARAAVESRRRVRTLSRSLAGLSAAAVLMFAAGPRQGSSTLLAPLAPAVELNGEVCAPSGCREMSQVGFSRAQPVLDTCVSGEAGVCDLRDVACLVEGCGRS